MANLKTGALLFVFGLQLIAIRPLVSTCWDFKSDFHSSSYDIKLQVEDAIHNDQGLALFWVRFFHNKVVYFVLDLFKKWLLFWDMNFLLSHLLPIGVFGFLLGFWYLFKNRQQPFWYFLALFIFLIPVPEIIFSFKVALILKVGLIIFPRLIFSLFGIANFLTNDKKRILITIGLIIISLYWLKVFGLEYNKFCAT